MVIITSSKDSLRERALEGQPSQKMKLHEKKESNIHRVKEVQLEELELGREYNVEKSLGEGSFAKILLATHRRTQTRVVLKAVHEELTSERDFYREFHYSYHLSPHPNILSSYAVAFRADNCYCFAQEYAPYGDLAANVRQGGLSEDTCKRIAAQLASALDFVHSKQLAHRDVKLENVLVFEKDMSKVKLCDFGCTKREGTLVSKLRCTWVPFLPPEIHEIVKNERYTCKRSADCWQFAIVLFVCLTGNPPWQSADPIQDPDYSAFQKWLKRRTTKIPVGFRRFSPRLLRYFRRVFEHKPDKRPAVTEINKYLKDAWWAPSKQHHLLSHSATSTSVDASENFPGVRRADSLLYLNTIVDERHNACDENKNRLRRLLNSYGLETTLDQRDMTKRVWEWVMQCDSSLQGDSSGLIGLSDCGSI
ncbi:serine/threonine-protein kinase SBK1 [Copidosoma floridanum]|uniref:serine/threonine-protein kinase SBK1 n=1 Tax=Copidosoma floridanum TaxID=29053 RepID=UPI0006C95FA2|nr:serine/threonine-protein kinase SBK1 [Copidosoma floridanum]